MSRTPPRVVFVFLLSIFLDATSKSISLYTFVYNRPDLLEIQLKTFRKFVKDQDYEIVVFNDAKNRALYNKLRLICQKYQAKHIKIPQEIHDLPYLDRTHCPIYHHPSVRNCNVVQWALNNHGFKKNGIVGLFDSDLFLVKELSFGKLMDSADIVAHYKPCTSHHADCKTLHPQIPPFGYFWIGFVIIDMQKAPNKRTLDFNCGKIGGTFVDAGGYTYNYIKKNPQAKIFFVDQLIVNDKFLCHECKSEYRSKVVVCNHSKNLITKYTQDSTAIQLMEELPLYAHYTKNVEWYLDQTFVHYCAGSGYPLYGIHRDKVMEINRLKDRAFSRFFTSLLQEEITIGG